MRHGYLWIEFACPAIYPVPTGGTPYSLNGGGGYPIKPTGGYPIQSRWGVYSFLLMGGITPFGWLVKVPLSGWWGYAPSGLDRGTPFGTGWGMPPVRTGWGTPPSRLDGVTPPLPSRLHGVPPVRTGWGTHPLSGDITAERALPTRRAVFLLRSHRRTFLSYTKVVIAWTIYSISIDASTIFTSNYLKFFSDCMN